MHSLFGTMLDAFARAIRKPQEMFGFTSDIEAVQMPSPVIHLRREPDGPVSIQQDFDINRHMPSPFRIGYVVLI